MRDERWEIARDRVADYFATRDHRYEVRFARRRTVSLKDLALADDIIDIVRETVSAPTKEES